MIGCLKMLKACFMIAFDVRMSFGKHVDSEIYCDLK